MEFFNKMCLQICSINVLAKFGVVEKENPCKFLACGDFPWRVPGGTRPHDIQNHNLISAPLEIPLSMRKVSDFDFNFAPILRRISTIIALTL